ncbi:MAG: imidazole glycerol phosphate synthase subunit HisH [Armatimonadota bacterium]|nr:MAG: imidazole glycerol phosphate synthase subunit HisH [Armatimonadota bacterium]
MIAIIDLGMGNLRSVEKALHRLGYPAQVTSHAPLVLKAPAVILPGVGAFARAIAALDRTGLEAVIRKTIEDGKPFMGICLGLQLLFEVSEEFGEVPGLGILRGRVRRLSGPAFAKPVLGPTERPVARKVKRSGPAPAWDPIPEDFGKPKPDPSLEAPGPGLKVPHVGWNSIRIENLHPVLAGIPEGSMFYFVHSYAPVPEEPDVVRATTTYGIEFVSAVGRRNVFACQFHPEKSGRVGLRMLENFARQAYPKGPTEPPGFEWQERPQRS